MCRTAHTDALIKADFKPPVKRDLSLILHTKSNLKVISGIETAVDPGLL